MSKVSYTPGPWKRTHCGLGVFSTNMPEGKNLAICTTDVVRRTLEENQANSQLIVLSPRIFEALVLTLPYIEMAEVDNIFKPGAVKKLANEIRELISEVEKG